MSLQPTALIPQMSPIPATFQGTPAELAAEMIRRMRIVVPAGVMSFFYTGETEPTTDVGPWLKIGADGGQWWTFRTDPTDGIKRYLPIDLSASETQWFTISSTAPDGPTVGTGTASDELPSVWFRTDATNALVGVYVWDGTYWKSSTGIVMSGPTASRPASPVEYQQYYDTTISVLIWWERGAWRTVSGVIGDVKFVAYETLDQAYQHNPGWSLFGESSSVHRGRAISQATQDYGVSPSTVTVPPTGVAVRGAFDIWNESVVIPQAADIPAAVVDYDSELRTANPTLVAPASMPGTPTGVPAVPMIALWCLVKG